MKRSYTRGLGALALIGMSAGMMYFLDPKSGRRRRATVVAKARHSYRVASDCARRTGDCESKPR